MTLLFMDGFDHYAEGEGARKWTTFVCSIGTAYARYPAAGSQGINIGQYNSISKVLSVNSSTLILGSAINITSVPFDHRISSYIYGISSSLGIHIVLIPEVSGELSVCRGDGTILGTSTQVVNWNSWCFAELKVIIHDTAGSIELRINGEEWISVAGIDTTNNSEFTANKITLFFVSHSTSVRHDDLYVCDGLGTENNDFLGDVRVATLRPNGAGNYTDFTPSAGSNYENVDDVVDIDDDTTYNSHDVATEKDSYALADMPVNVGNVHGIQINTTMRKDDAAAKEAKPFLRTNSVDYPQGSAINLWDSYVSTRNIVELNPNDSAVWEKTDVDALEIGLEIIS